MRKIGIVGVACALMVACGQPAATGESAGPVLAQIGGTVESNGVVLDQGTQIRIAVIWVPALAGRVLREQYTQEDFVAFSTDVAFDGKFPFNYSLDLRAVPPKSLKTALVTVGNPPHDAEIRLASGMIVAYADNDDNHRLEMSNLRSPTNDRIIGITQPTWYDATGYLIHYLESEQLLPGDLGPGSPIQNVGFNLAVGDHGLDWGTQVPITLTNDPRANIWICNEVIIPVPEGHQPCGLDLTAE
jgi:hypothetical protein